MADFLIKLESTNFGKEIAKKKHFMGLRRAAIFLPSFWSFRKLICLVSTTGVLEDYTSSQFTLSLQKDVNQRLSKLYVGCERTSDLPPTKSFCRLAAEINLVAAKMM